MQDGVHLQYNSIAGLWYDHLVVDQAVYTNDRGWEHNLPLGAVGYMDCSPSNQPRGLPACFHMNWLGDALWVNRIKGWFIIQYPCLIAILFEFRILQTYIKYKSYDTSFFKTSDKEYKIKENFNPPSSFSYFGC